MLVKGKLLTYVVASEVDEIVHIRSLEGQPREKPAPPEGRSPPKGGAEVLAPIKMT